MTLFCKNWLHCLDMVDFDASFAWPELEDLEHECLPETCHPATNVTGADSWVGTQLLGHVPCRIASNSDLSNEPSPDWPQGPQAGFAQGVTQQATPAQSSSGTQDKKLANRAHQKRYRERQKVRSGFVWHACLYRVT